MSSTDFDDFDYWSSSDDNTYECKIMKPLALYQGVKQTALNAIAPIHTNLALYIPKYIKQFIVAHTLNVPVSAI
jgi:hypothetical protein